MKVMKCMHSEKAPVAWLNFLGFEINNVKHRASSHVISKVSFSSGATWPEVNFLCESREEVPVHLI